MTRRQFGVRTPSRVDCARSALISAFDLNAALPNDMLSALARLDEAAAGAMNRDPR